MYFAHSLPYTYSMLNEYLSAQKIKRHTLCHSLAGNKVEYIIITNKPKTPPVQKQVIMLTSRVHPGETGASWMIHGLIDTLLNPKDTKEEELVNNLKDHFEFYIIPMLNVDGVINGNYRCSLAACDLNRKWLKPSKALHPPVYYTKKLCTTLMEDKQFFLYLDFHGHSVKKNIF
jgi:cytosolic carboxypeptidase protein 2/3